MLKLRFVWICFLLLGPKIYLKADAPLNLTKLSLEELMDLEVASAHSEPPGSYQIDSVVHPPVRPAEQETRASVAPIAPDLGEPNAFFLEENLDPINEWTISPEEASGNRQAVPGRLQASPTRQKENLPLPIELPEFDEEK